MHDSTFLKAPYRLSDLDGDCPHCTVTDKGDGSIVMADEGYWCRTCGHKIRQTDVSDVDGGFTYEQYDNSGRVRLVGGYEDPWPPEHLRRDDDSIVEGEAISL